MESISTARHVSEPTSSHGSRANHAYVIPRRPLSLRDHIYEDQTGPGLTDASQASDAESNRTGKEFVIEADGFVNTGTEMLGSG